MSGIHYVFVYGSLLNYRVMQARVPRAKPVRVARLQNRRLEFVGGSSGWGGAVATIVPASSRHTVPGLVWEIDDAGLRALDRYEGCPFLYTRRTVAWKGPEGGVVHYYEHNGAPLGPPSESYLTAILVGCQFAGIDAKHIRAAVKRAVKYDNNVISTTARKYRLHAV